ncbi:MAG: AMP-binding protein [Phycisphaerales bacterium]|nr:AMP-binding protein [Phycisphaerales bacterium]
MLVDALLATQRRQTSAEAVRDPSGSMTFGELTALAAALRGLILENTQRDTVGLLLPGSGAFNAALFGTMWAGKTAVPLNFLLSADELAAIARDAGFDAVFSIRAFEKLTASLPARTFFVEELDLEGEVAAFARKPFPPAPETSADSVAVLPYTSGTTGACKGVELTARGLKANANVLIQQAELGDGDRFLSVIPPFHVLGLTGNVIVPTVRGLATLMVPRFSPAAVLAAIESFRPTMIIAIPSMFAAILRQKSAARDAFAGVRMLISGGEPLPETVATAFRARFGRELHEGYGLTETSPVVSLNTPSAFRAGSVGRVVPGVEVRIAGPNNESVPVGGDGEIMVRGLSVMRGYHNRPQETAAVLSADGWFRTGDIGAFDGEGFLRITGRKKEMMIVGGENVFPREIETVLERHEQVAEAAVIGVADGSRGEVAVAFVILNAPGSATENDLRSFARERLAGYKVPRQVKILEDFPRGPTGKVQKRELRGLLSDG